MKKVLFVLIILILLALTACQEVGEARFLPTKSAPGRTLKAISCFDSDGGINYDVKGTITVTYNTGYKRVEVDYCNKDGTLREWYCGKKGAPGGLLRAENYVKCAHGCKDGACLSVPKPLCPLPEKLDIWLHVNESKNVRVNGVAYKIELLSADINTLSAVVKLHNMAKGELLSIHQILPIERPAGGFLILRNVGYISNIPPIRYGAGFVLIR